MMGDVSRLLLGTIVRSNMSEICSNVHLCVLQCSLARCMGSLPCFEGHCFGPFCWGFGETVCSVISQCQPRHQAHASFRTTTNPKPGFLRSPSRISTLAVPNLVPDFSPEFFFPNFLVGFPAAAAILRPEKKNQGENQGTCAPTRAEWCESLPRLAAEAPQIPRVAEWRPLAAVGLCAC